jgi:superfamily II DNA helicase RecQ
MLGRDQARQYKGKDAPVSAMEEQLQHRAKSLHALTKYCEATNKCRHRFIADYFGDEEVPPCDYACDWCKDAVGLVKRKEKGLASEEWCSTQREQGRYDIDEYE